MPADGALICPFLGETLAHDGLGGWAAAGPHPRGGGVIQGTAQPMAIASKCFPDAPRFWTLPLPSITNREGRVIREPQLQGGQDRGRGAGVTPRDLWQERHVEHLLSCSRFLPVPVPLPPPTRAKEKWILTCESWALRSQHVSCCQKSVRIRESV